MLLTFDTKKSSEKHKSQQATTSDSLLSQKATSDAQVIQNVILKNDHLPDAKVFKFTQRQSKGGCLTCKIRKKRCSEEHPQCADCVRLNKRCVWATSDMTNEQIKDLKKKVEQEEEDFKLKRKQEYEAKKQMKKGKKLNIQVSTESKQNFEQNRKRKNSDSTSKTTKKKQQQTEDESLQQQQNIPHHHQNQPNQQHQHQQYHHHHHHHPQHHPQQQRVSTNVIEEQEPSALDYESFTKGQTPIAANLLYLSQNSPQITPGSPRWDNLSIPSPGSTAQFFDQFNSFLESNLRGHHNERDHSNKITSLDGEEEIEELPSTTSPTTLATRFSPFLAAFDLDHTIPTFNELHHAPQPSIYSQLNLDEMGIKFYDYYRNRLSRLVSIVPPELNYYNKVFLPMAAVNPGILNTILSWSAYHMGGENQAMGDMYMQKALKYLDETPIRTDSDAIQKLANCLILIGTEICRGDVTKWGSYLKLGAKVIKDRGGLFKFNQDKEQQWLISNFVYHDILASSTSERGTYFPVEDYGDFLIHQFGFGVDPLQGIVKPLFNIIGEISTLASETKKLLRISSNSLGYGIMTDDEDYEDEDKYKAVPGLDNSPPGYKDGEKVSRYASLLVIMQKASVLENKINSVKPDPNDLSSFTNEELELQMTLFELFQYTAKLHLRQSVLRLNPSSLETQFILCELLKCLDIVLKSPVEGSLCFPLFIAGMNCTTKRDRRMMRARFDDILGRYSFKNIDRAKTVMENVWEIDPTGTRCVDWYEIVKGKDWDLSFA